MDVAEQVVMMLKGALPAILGPLRDLQSALASVLMAKGKDGGVYTMWWVNMVSGHLRGVFPNLYWSKAQRVTLETAQPDKKCHGKFCFRREILRISSQVNSQSDLPWEIWVCLVKYKHRAIILLNEWQQMHMRVNCNFCHLVEEHIHCWYGQMNILFVLKSMIIHGGGTVGD